MLVGLVAAIGGPLVQYGRLTERQEKNDITLVDQRRDIAAVKESVQRMREDASVRLELVRLTEQVKALSAEIQELRSRRR
jgi:hypothetical protein